MVTPRPAMAIASRVIREDINKLPARVSGLVLQLSEKYSQDPKSAGLSFEHIQGTDHLYSVRLNRQYRGITYKLPKSRMVLLVHVGNHDDAYAWAKRHKCGVNPETGTVQVYPTDMPVLDLDLPKPDPSASGLLDNMGLSDQRVMKLGIPKELVPLARTVSHEFDFQQIKALFPAEAQDALFMLLAGYTFKEARAELSLADEGAVDVEDLDKALDRPGSKAQFWVVDNQEELERMLKAPLEQWRIFLHPSQRAIVERKWNGPVRVLGGAGTGKTVVAMHRAKWLLQQTRDQKRNKVLFLTFSVNLASDLRRNMRTLITSDVDLQRLEVINLDRWVSNALKTFGTSLRLLYDNLRGRDIKSRVWGEILDYAGNDLEFGRDFYPKEWQSVALDLGALDEQSYLLVPRTGRGTPLTRAKRKKIWKVFAAYRSLLHNQGYIEREDAFHEVQGLAAAEPERLPYASVVVDESQDFGNSAFRLIHTLSIVRKVSSAVEPVPDSLFLVGDAHQRIYNRRVTLSHCGINIRGRSSRLTINYRTTDAILKTAVSIMEGVSVDDLDKDKDSLARYHSLFYGPKPERKLFNSAEEMVSGAIAWIEDVKKSEGMLYSEFCFVGRTNRQLTEWKEALESQGIAASQLTPDIEDTGDIDAVRIATAHRVKGLEFTGVVLMDADEYYFPLLAGQPPANEWEEEQLLTRERSLMHVAVSRAKRHLLLCSHRGWSEFLKQ